MDEITESKGQEVPKSDDSQTFPAKYVNELREEAKANRLKLAELQEKLSKMQSSQQEADGAKLESETKYQELYEKAIEELKTYKDQYSEASNALAQYRELEDRERQDLLNKIPEKKRELYGKVSDIMILKDIVNTYMMPAGVDSLGNSIGINDGHIMSLEGLNLEQMSKLANENPSLYAELIRQSS